VKLNQHLLVKDCDIVHLHWVANFIDYSSFFETVKKPIVWTLHDMNPFQGGFHYKNDQEAFRRNVSELDLEQFDIKKRSLQNFPSQLLRIVGPSRWITSSSQQSEILGRFKHFNIPNPINTDIFKPSRSRRSSEKNSERINVLFVAESLHNKRKGFDLLTGSMISEQLHQKFHFIAVGDTGTGDRLKNIEYTGSIRSENEMAGLYNRADIFVLPSREDNLPNSMVESLCCGTPVVGFKIGGLRECIKNGENGILSEEVSAEGLKKALLYCAEKLNSFDRNKISKNAHALFNRSENTGKYIKIYQEMQSSDSISPISSAVSNE
jgi:glycosyltransferase involved in cell wall biosynthesis